MNVALLSKWCHLMALWMLILIKECFEVSYHSVEKNVKSFSKGPFLSHFLIFSISLEIIHRMSNINNFPLFLIKGSLIKTYHNVLIFQYSTFCWIVLVNKFLFFGYVTRYFIIQYFYYLWTNLSQITNRPRLCITSRYLMQSNFSVPQFSIFLG